MFLRLFICPACGRIQAISRRTSVTCNTCEEIKMKPLKITFEKYSCMSKQERDDYVDAWMYIFHKGDVKKEMI